MLAAALEGGWRFVDTYDCGGNVQCSYIYVALGRKHFSQVVTWL